MKPLFTNYRVLTWLCVCPSAENESWWKKLAYIIFMTLIFTVNFGIFLTSAAFCLKSLELKLDLQETLFAIMQAVGFWSLWYLMIVALILRHQINGIFTDLSRIYDKSKREFEIFDFLSII